jgi:hypothetical protein
MVVEMVDEKVGKTVFLMVDGMAVRKVSWMVWKKVFPTVSKMGFD